MKGARAVSLLLGGLLCCSSAAVEEWEEEPGVFFQMAIDGSTNGHTEMRLEERGANARQTTFQSELILVIQARLPVGSEVGLSDQSVQIVLGPYQGAGVYDFSDRSHLSYSERGDGSGCVASKGSGLAAGVSTLTVLSDRDGVLAANFDVVAPCSRGDFDSIRLHGSLRLPMEVED